MSHLRLRRESPDELLFVGHNPVGGAVALVLSVGVAVLATRSDGGAAQVAQVLAGVFGVAAAFGILFRDTLQVDRRQRCWTRTRGLWPRPVVYTGGYDRLVSVEVREDPSYHRGKPRREWEVWLRAADEAASIRLLETPDAETARRAGERFSALFELDRAA